ncbi:uncharacterized protein A1O5_12674 [Cladophialophora psammophila CBS 110553]|uniref:Uncharacterized protein n=1 Tax=Cladophialophora psammophila CBS 110553 TaxID=1182543 RepID=W9VL25_9EURO|nr:uncharacterized protein A1O5_12674 [Cladophialophora psammophila CBS 110553]EXJ56218.1 hypothetical protein A1O5_12674 [Cladophialophora psammophila CBS 110553]
MSHPLVAGQIPEPRICSRPACTRAQSVRWDASHFRPLVVEVHHYYHIGPGFEARPDLISTAEMPGEGSLTGRVEVAGDPSHGTFSHRYTQGPLSPIREESPPPVNRLTKPTLYCY